MLAASPRLMLSVSTLLLLMPKSVAPTRLAPPLLLRTFMGNTMTSAAKDQTPAQPLTVAEGAAIATFGAGCFWGVEKSFRRKYAGKGLIDTQVGYCGGHKEGVNYREVCSGQTGHAEAIQLTYDPSKVTYEALVDFFYRMHDPTTVNRQGGDTGTQYRSAIFYHDEAQKKAAVAETAAAQTHFGSTKIVTTIEPVGKFWPAEAYHQEYLDKNPHGYECPTHFERSWDKIESQHKK
ncbi:peptide methionine sulfoxide reductase MsrA [Entophlyctis helioformis]|nr:peptide methionine sulfoxide reductase MsrA [Entophlyctis helioformis]